MYEHKSSQDSFGEDLKNVTFTPVGCLGFGRMPRHAISWLQSSYSFLKTQCQLCTNEKSNIPLFYWFIIYFQFCKELLLIVRKGKKCLHYKEVFLNYCLKILNELFLHICLRICNDFLFLIKPTISLMAV